MFYIYILLQNNKNLYAGFTENLKRRYKQHTDGLNTSTKYKRPLKLIHYQAYLLKTDTVRREKFLKTTELLRQKIKDILMKEKAISQNS